MGQAVRDVPGAVGRIVVHNQNFQPDRLAENAVDQRLNVGGFVVSRNDDNSIHGGFPKPERAGTSPAPTGWLCRGGACPRPSFLAPPFRNPCLRLAHNAVARRPQGATGRSRQARQRSNAAGPSAAGRPARTRRRTRETAIPSPETSRRRIKSPTPSASFPK